MKEELSPIAWSPSVSSGASQQLCYQHGLPQRRQSSRQPRCLQSAPERVGCVASEAEHSPGTEFPTLLCMQELLTLPCPTGRMRIPAAAEHSFCSTKGSTWDSSFLQQCDFWHRINSWHLYPMAEPPSPAPLTPAPARQICSLCRQGLLYKGHND